MTLEEQIRKIVLQVYEDEEWIGGPRDFDPIERAVAELTAFVREEKRKTRAKTTFEFLDDYANALEIVKKAREEQPK